MILDFDGVILESSGIKAEVHRAMFEGFREHREEIRAYQERNGGLPRRRQFRDVYEGILERPLSEEKMEELAGRYSELVFRRVMEAPYVRGAREFLESHHGRLPLYLASATPEEELRRIVDGRGLARFFRGVFGTPREKAAIIGDILRLGHDCEEAVFVGDALSDRRAAEEAGVRFIARLGSAPELADSPYRIRDLTELPALLDRL